MDLDKETYYESDVGQEDSPESSSEENEESDNGVSTVWETVQQNVLSKCPDHWMKLLSEDRDLFRMRFKEYFIESCKEQLPKLHRFLEDDETWIALIETKSKVSEDIEEEDEALLSAIDQRKYKLLKTIDWKSLENHLQEVSDETE